MTCARSSGWMRCSHSSGSAIHCAGREAEHRLDLRAHIQAATGRSRLPAVRRDRHALEQRSKALFAEVTARPRWWKCDPRAATFVHQRVERVIGPVAVAALGNRLDDALGIFDRAGSGTPQAFPLRSSNRVKWPMTFPGIWGGRERIEVGPTGRALGLSPPTPTLQTLWRDPLATIFGDACAQPRPLTSTAGPARLRG